MTGKTEKGLRFRLWRKFAAGVLLLECLLLCTVVPVVEGQIRRSVLEELLKRGIAAAENMASANAGAAAAGDVENIQENVAMALEWGQLSYAAVLIGGHVAGYAGPSDIETHLLGSPEAERAAKAEQPRVRYIDIGGREYCDIGFPMLLGDTCFGTARCGLSLQPIGASVLQIRWKLGAIGTCAVVFSCLAAVLFSRSITTPLARVRRSVEAVSRGEYEHHPVAAPRDEVALLGARVEEMKQAVNATMRRLADANDETFRANRRLAREVDHLARAEAALKTSIQEAEAGSAAKTRLLNHIGHRLRTPVNDIVGMSRQLLAAEAPPELGGHLQQIHASAERLLGDLDGILDFSRLERGDLQLTRKRFNLLHLIEDTVGLLAPEADEKGLEMSCFVSHDVPLHLVGDARRLRQILRIVLGNAIQFTAEGEVSAIAGMTTEDDGRRTVRFEVRDTGVGIPPEDAEAFFELFIRPDESAGRQHGGLGLGLAVARRLVVLMGGRIGVERTAGSGAAFWFTVPCTPPAAPSSAAAPALLKGIRVLVVDDNETCRTHLCRHLAAWGVEHESAADATAAMAGLQRAASTGRPFTLVLLDATLPDTSAPAFVRKIRSHPETTDVRIVLCAPGRDMASLDSAVLPADTQILVKPVRRSRLQDCLAGLASEARGPAPRRETAWEPKDGIRGDARVLAAEENPIHPSDFQALAGMYTDPEAMHRILGIFLADAASRVAAIRDAVASDDMNALRHQSYTLKSSSASLGARRFSDLLFELEQAACAADRRRARRVCESVDIEYQRVAAALRTKIDIQSS